MIKVYRKTVTIKAEQFDPENGIIPQGVFEKEYEHTTSGMISEMIDELNTGKPSHNWHIKTLEGELKVKPGDWIATGVNGEHWEISDDVFKKTYSELPVIPKDVDEYIRWCQGEGGVGNVSDAMDYAHGDIDSWIYDERNSDTFARAWLDGYMVDEEHD